MLSTSHALTADYSSWSSGSWSKRLLEAAALARPDMVGWSGTVDRKMSKWFLKRAKSPVSLRRLAGRRLKILAPRTAKERSLFPNPDKLSITNPI